MKGRITTEIGYISVDADVIARYAGLAAIECFGVVGMAMISVKDGLVKLLKRESLAKGVDVNISEEAADHLSIDFHVITVYGISIETIADNLMSNVKYKVETFTGMHVDSINIFVEGVRVID